MPNASEASDFFKQNEKIIFRKLRKAVESAEKADQERIEKAKIAVGSTLLGSGIAGVIGLRYQDTKTLLTVRVASGLFLIGMGIFTYHHKS